MTDLTSNIGYSIKDLFSDLVQLERELIVLQEDIKQRKIDSTYNEGDNPKGFDKAEVNNVAKAAKVKAKEEDVADKIEVLQLIEQIIAENE